VIATPVQDGEEGNVYKLQYQLKDLPAGDFMVTLRARNVYGWTNQAKPHSFTISMYLQPHFYFYRSSL
jgi:hypothetical protein